MKNNLIAATILAIALVGVGNAQGTTSSAELGENPTQTQVNQLTHDAHTPAEYKSLASYYSKQQQNYQQKADEAKQLWEQRSLITTSLYAKYPKPADSARYRYEYFSAKASTAAGLSAKYGQLAQ